MQTCFPSAGWSRIYRGEEFQMTISVPPDLQRFIEEKVQSGEYASPEEVVQAGLSRLMDDELDDDTLAPIAEGEAQLDRGEGTPLDEAFQRLRQKHGARSQPRRFD